MQWAGFEQSEATWEPLSTLAEDVPVLIAQYAATLPNESELFVTAAREQVGKKFFSSKKHGGIYLIIEGSVAREPNPIGIPDGIDFGPPVIRTAVLKTGVYNIISGSIDTLSIETTKTSLAVPTTC